MTESSPSPVTNPIPQINPAAAFQRHYDTMLGCREDGFDVLYKGLAQRDARGEPTFTAVLAAGFMVIAGHAGCLEAASLLGAFNATKAGDARASAACDPVGVASQND